MRTQWFRDGSWSEGSPLPHNLDGVRTHVMITISDTEVFICAGFSSTYVETTWIYDIVQDTYTQRVRLLRQA